MAIGMDAPPDAVLQWDRGSLGVECERAATVREGVEAYLGRPVFVEDGKLVVRVALSFVEENAGRRVVATVTQGEGSGERVVTGDDTCASLDEPLTLVVALMVDRPASATEQAAEEKPGLAPPPPAPVPLPPPDDEPAREILTTPSLERSQSAPPHAAFLALGLVSMGSLPETGTGIGLVAVVKPRGFWGLGVEGELLLPQERALGTGSLEVSSLVLRGSLCPLQGASAGVWWSVCASMGVSRLALESRDLIGAKSRTEWIPLPGASVRAAWRLSSPWMVGGGLEAVFPVSPDRYVYRDVGGASHYAFEMSSLGLTANLVVGVMVD
jgi:hypothetical protein